MAEEKPTNKQAKQVGTFAEKAANSGKGHLLHLEQLPAYQPPRLYQRFCTGEASSEATSIKN